MLTKKTTSDVNNTLKDKQEYDKNTTNPQTKETTGIKTGQNLTTPMQAKKSATQIIIKYNCGFGNSLHIRGDAAGLSWDKGTKLLNIDSDTWVWESDRPFTQCNFKILINDQNYEQGENHHIRYGAHETINPSF